MKGEWELLGVVGPDLNDARLVLRSRDRPPFIIGAGYCLPDQPPLGRTR